MDNMVNPFADYGAIVSGNRFIGRKAQLLQIQRRVIEKKSNVSIIGERRIGKSSLAHQALIGQAEQLHKQQIVPVWIDAGIYNEPHRFFCGIVKWCYWELEDSGLLSRVIREAAQAVQSKLECFEFDQVQFFFQQTQRQGIQIILVLDEFDQVCEIFRSDSSLFHQLSAICNRHQSTLVTVSRRSVRVLEQRVGADTPFARSFEHCYVGMFIHEEMKEFLSRLEATGVPLGKDELARIQDYCGNHPFLLDMLASVLVEQFRSKHRLDFSLALEQVGTQINDYYEDLVERLDADGWLPLIYSLTQGEISTAELPGDLLKYDLVHQRKANKYVTFSQHFQTYLDRIRPHHNGTLTERELAILRHLALGHQNKEIALALDISINTVKFHVTNILTKLSVTNRTEAIAQGIKLQMISSNTPH